MSPHAQLARDEQDINGRTSTVGSPNARANGNAIMNGSLPAMQSQLCRGHDDDVFDLICVGFGPANLALAIALHDALENHHPLPGLAELYRRPPKVLFLERQEQFGWHRGMLLPGAKMQITFVKDLATLRNPRSEFTFLNYLHKQNRLANFTNLNTFLPHRIEYEDYMKWCAAAFNDVVEYSQEVLRISPAQHDEPNRSTRVNSFEVTAKDVNSEAVRTFCSKNIVMAVGGKPQIPAMFPQDHPRILHSAHYSTNIERILPDKFASYTLAVVGCGQSAAECFNDLHSRFPNAKTRLLIKGAALRPSDDSPFVNEIFDPEQIDSFYKQEPEQREASIEQDRGTNYGVVRINLLEHIYETMYMQRLQNPNHEDWQHQILPHHAVIDAQALKNSVQLRVQKSSEFGSEWLSTEEDLNVDALIIATGYSRNMHQEMLKPVEHLRSPSPTQETRWSVTRDYKVELDKTKVAKDAGIWLSGCNEQTHGLSDTLLSVVATRGGELTHSIFGG